MDVNEPGWNPDVMLSAWWTGPDYDAMQAQAPIDVVTFMEGANEFGLVLWRESSSFHLEQLVLISVTPDTIQNGTHVTLDVVGTGFPSGAQIVIGGTIVLPMMQNFGANTVTRIDSTHLVVEWDVVVSGPATQTVEIVVGNADVSEASNPLPFTVTQP